MSRILCWLFGHVPSVRFHPDYCDHLRKCARCGVLFKNKKENP